MRGAMRGAAKGAVARKERLAALLPAEAQFVAGLVALPAFLLVEGPIPKAALAAAYMALGWLGGKRARPLFALVASAIIVAFNCLLPSGRVLAEFAGFTLTEGALLSGVGKALTVEGLLFLSQASVRGDLRLPGSFGRLLGESFSFFDRISAQRGRFDAKKPFASIDSILLSLYDSEAQGGPRARRALTAKGVAFAAALPAMSWAAAALSLAGIF